MKTLVSTKITVEASPHVVTPRSPSGARPSQVRDPSHLRLHRTRRRKRQGRRGLSAELERTPSAAADPPPEATPTACAPQPSPGRETRPAHVDRQRPGYALTYTR